MYIEDNNLMFSYRGFDDDLVTDQDRERIEAYDRENNNDNSDYQGMKVYADEFYTYPYSRWNVYDYQQLLYKEVPKHDDLEYVPAPFREKFEICLWKIEELGIAKIKHNYFTPLVSNWNFIWFL